MVQLDWSLLGPPVDIGANFQQGMKMGQAMVAKRRQENALKAYMTNPDDVTARNALAVEDPDMVYKMEQTRAVRAKADMDAQSQSIEANRERIMRGAQIIRQVQPKDDAGWQQVRSIAQRDGIDLTDVPETFDPAYVDGMVKYADTFEPVKPETAAPADVRSYQYRQSLPESERAQFDRFQQNSRPQIFGSSEAGYSVYDPNTPPPAAAPSVQMPTVTDDATYNAVTPGAEYRDKDGNIRRKAGGQPPAAGNFPDRLAPR